MLTLQSLFGKKDAPQETPVSRVPAKYRNIDLFEQHRLASKLAQSQTADEYYFIDVVGTCNLKCPSCAVGNMPALFSKGLMSPDTLKDVLAKIARETEGKERVFIDLYNWGEPLLHPEIGDIIRIVKEAGFGCGISSNLVAGKNLAAAVKAEPDYIRISLSGYHNETYQETHAGGDINLVKAHMHMLRHYLDLFRNRHTVVQVGFHVYRSNFPNDFHLMMKLADELGFLFSPTLATIMPVEKAVAALENEGLTEQDKALLDKLVVSPERWRTLNLESDISLPDCQYRSQRSTINYDGSVALCCATYGTDKIVSDNFLTTDNADLIEARQTHDYCGTCMNNRLHYVYTGAYPASIAEEAVSVLGNEYAEYLTATAQIGDRDLLLFEGRFYTIQELYDLGMECAGKTDQDAIERAEQYMDALVADAPQFGEGLFQAAAVKKRLGRDDEAAHLSQLAADMVPDNAAYQQQAADCKISQE